MDIPIVVTFNLYNPKALTLDGFSVEEACKQARDLGAAVVGVNCGFGPRTMLPVVRRIREALGPDCPLAALPCAFRQLEETPSWMQVLNVPRSTLGDIC